MRCEGIVPGGPASKGWSNDFGPPMRSHGLAMVSTRRVQLLLAHFSRTLDHLALQWRFIPRRSRLVTLSSERAM
jgi:hypothetical protein